MKIRSLFIICLFSLSVCANKVNYKLIIENPHRNFFTIEISYEVMNEKFVDFVIPVWTPGSYVIKDWSKNVIDVKAKNENDFELICYKKDKQRWRVEPSKSKNIILSYKVYAYSKNNPYHAHIGRDFAYFNGAVIFMYIDGKKNIPHTLEFVYPDDWEFHTSLQVKLSENKYQAVNYDEFIDCPAFLGKLYKFSFEVQGKNHFVVLNSWYDTNEDQIIEDLSKMINWYYKLFGELPYKNYTFFLRVSQPGGGGIEHLYSNVSSITPQSLNGDIEDKAYYSKLLMLESHEYFHLFNVKRIRPTGLGPYDYTKEVYTKMLWFSEGFTTYYSHRPLSKAGIISEEKVLESWSSYLNRLINNTASNLKPVSQYSFDAWLRSDIPDYSFRTYYTNGAMIALMLDIDMRLKTDHNKNMDGFFKFMYDSVYKINKTFAIEEFYQYLFDYSKIDYIDFFKKYIIGSSDLPVKEYLNKIGLELKTENEVPFLGIKLSTKIKDAAIVNYVYPESPADKLKIERGDHIVSLENEKATLNTWNDILNKIILNDTFEIKWIHENKIYNGETTMLRSQVLKYNIYKKSPSNEFKENFLNELLLP